MACAETLHPKSLHACQTWRARGYSRTARCARRQLNPSISAGACYDTAQLHIRPQTSARLSCSLTHEIATALALPAEPTADARARWERNIAVLESVHGGRRAGAGAEERVRRAVLANPSLLNADLESWHQFLVSGFGLPPDTFAKLAADCPNLLTHGDVWTAGCAMLFFKSMGWRNRDIAQRIVGYYPQLLMLDRPRDIDPVLRLLERLECRGDNLRLLVWEYPRIFDKNYRRQIRKFQYLGVYGLSLNGGGSGSQEGHIPAAAASTAGIGEGMSPEGVLQGLQELEVGRQAAGHAA